MVPFVIAVYVYKDSHSLFKFSLCQEIVLKDFFLYCSPLMWNWSKMKYGLVKDVGIPYTFWVASSDHLPHCQTLKPVLFPV